MSRHIHTTVQCDQCGVYLRQMQDLRDGSWFFSPTPDGAAAARFADDHDASAMAREAGWYYDAVRDVCPGCRRGDHD